MLSILEASNFPNQNNNPITKNRISTENNKQMFSKIFNNEKKSLLLNKQNTTKNIPHNSQNKTKNLTNQTNDLNSTNKPYGKSESNAIDNKTSLNKTKQLKEYKDINIDETVENIEDEPVDKDSAVSLQSILLTMLENISGLENMDNKDIEISADQLQNLDNLKEQLLFLLETTDTLIDDFLKQDIKTVIELINKTNEEHLLNIGEEQLLNDKTQLVTYKSGELMSNLEELKNNIQSILNRPNIGRLADSQKLYIKNNFLNSEEQLTESEEPLLDVSDIEKEIKNNIKAVDKFTPSNKEEQFFKQSEGDNEILFKEQVIVPQQNIIDQNINLKVIKDQIIEPRQFINGIAQKAGTFILKGKNEMNIQLIPENLGKLSIKIGLNEGTLTGKIYAENYSVKETIEANLNQLRDSLEEQGLNIASLEVHINDNSQNFERSLYQSKFTNGQKLQISPVETDGNFITLEEDVGQTNPYLITSQIDSLV